MLWGTHCTKQSVLQSRRLQLHSSQVITTKQANKERGTHTHYNFRSQNSTMTRASLSQLRSLPRRGSEHWNKRWHSNPFIPSSCRSFHSLEWPWQDSEQKETWKKSKHDKQQIHSNCKWKKYDTKCDIQFKMKPLDLCNLFQARASLLPYLCLITFTGSAANEMYSLEGGISSLW